MVQLIILPVSSHVNLFVLSRLQSVTNIVESGIIEVKKGNK